MSKRLKDNLQAAALAAVFVLMLGISILAEQTVW